MDERGQASKFHLESWIYAQVSQLQPLHLHSPGWGSLTELILHNITALHYIVLDYSAVPFTTVHCITVQYTALQCPA